MTHDQLYTGAEVQRLVGDVASEVARDHPQGVVLVGVLKASVIFMADLIRVLAESDIDVRLDFIETSSFEVDSGRVRLVQDLREDIGGRDVVLMTTLVDTGLRLAYLRGQLAARHPSSLRVGALFDKVDRRILPVELDYVGATVPDRFLVGYGLDAWGHGRHLHGVSMLDAEADFEIADLTGWIQADHQMVRDALSEGPSGE